MADYNTSIELTSLFLQQSLKDSEDDLNRILAGANIPHWDAVIITASNALQADGYRKQLDYRRELGRLPENTEFLIVTDEGGKRVGSGGSTLSVKY